MAEQKRSFAESGAGNHGGDDGECDGTTNRHQTSASARPASAPALEATHAATLDTLTTGNARMGDGRQVPSPPLSLTQQSTTEKRSTIDHVTGMSSESTRRSFLTRGSPDDEDGCAQPKMPVRSESAVPSLMPDSKISSFAAQGNTQAAERLPHKKNRKTEKPTRPGAVAVPFAPAEESGLQTTVGENGASLEEEKTEESPTHETAEGHHTEEGLGSNTRSSNNKEHHCDFGLVVEHNEEPHLSSSPDSDDNDEEQDNDTYNPPAGPGAPMEEPLCTAELVPNEHDVEARIKQGIIDGAAHADMVKPPSVFSHWRLLLAMLLVAGVIVAVVVVVLDVIVNNDDSPAKDRPQNNIPSNESGFNLTEFIMSISGDTIHENGTAQNEAFIWLSERDFSTLSDGAKLVDLYVLSVLHFATGGPYWKKKAGFQSSLDACLWNNGQSVAFKRGAFCDSATTVDEIKLDVNNLNGSIPDELGALTALRVIDVGENNLVGTIPPSFGNLTLLEKLDLSSNSLSGTFPDELAALTSLLVIKMDGNNLAGTLPKSFGNLTMLETLDLSWNSLTGTIPDELAALTSLRVIKTDGNNLAGTIPPSFGNLTLLETLDLSDNSLTGAIPTAIAALPSLKSFDAGQNSLTGGVPSFASQHLSKIRLHLNPLNGSLNEFFNSKGVAELRDIHFPNMQLTGSLPASIGNFAQLKSIDLYINDLTGTIPSEIGLLTNIETLSVSHNDLIGTVPIEMGNCSRLRTLSLPRSLRGHFPLSVAHLPWLNDLSIEGNVFTNDYNETFCTREDPIKRLHASCLEDKVSCPCCTWCCNATGYECVSCDSNPDICFGN